MPTLISGDFQLLASSPQLGICVRGAYINKAGFIGGYFYDQAELEKSLTYHYPGKCSREKSYVTSIRI